MKQKMLNKGITLIALVITIIVLLILAGVTIVMLIGDEGILTKTTDARNAQNNGTQKDQIGLAYNATKLDSKGKAIEAEKLQEELRKYDNGATVITEGENFKITFTNGNVYTLKKDGTIEKATNNSGSTATAEEVNKHIGQVVEEYEESKDLIPTIKQQIGGWRIFYASDTEMFLISTNTITSNDAFGGGHGIPLAPRGMFAPNNYGNAYVYINEEDKYNGATDDVFTGEGYGAKYNETYNSAWHKAGMTDTEDRSKATAYLCDTENWKEYVNKEKGATYAVGGPTKELLVRSWVASGQATRDVDTILADTTASTSGYEYDKPDEFWPSSPIKNTILPTLEGKTDGLFNNGKEYWLASPGSGETYAVCSMELDGFVNTFRVFDGPTCGVRPLVSISMSAVQIENGVVTIKEN